MSGRLIVFEGGEACGKSTQAARLAKALDALLTREPGGTAVGEQIRGLLLDPAVGKVDARAEALMVAGARAQHVAEVIDPALKLFGGCHGGPDRKYQVLETGVHVADPRHPVTAGIKEMTPNTSL